MATTIELLRSAGVTDGEAARAGALAVEPSGDLERDTAAATAAFAAAAGLLARLPRRPQRSPGEQAAAEALLADARRLREAFLGRHAVAVYQRLTAGRTRFLRLQEIADGAAQQFPGLVPTPAQVAEEQRHPQMEQDGHQIDQGILLAHLLADRDCGLHLLHAMRRPTAAALGLREEFRATGRASFPSMTLERQGRAGRVTFHHQAWLNAEDDEYQGALETLVDLILLDDAIEVGVLRGAPMTKAKYAGRRVFGSGINLTHLYFGKISLIRFMLERETGPLGKIQRGHSGPVFRGGELEDGVEKPFVGAVDSFAIGGHCQVLLILDRVIAQRGSYFNLPARKEGIIPGVANLRLPRFVGERAARQGIFFNRQFPTDGPAGHLLCDEVVDGDAEMDAAIERAVTELPSAGTTSLRANRRAIRTGVEPIDDFRRYMALYAREQAYCMYSPALIDNLVRNWEANRRSL
jgi:thioesterase DpgC